MTREQEHDRDGDDKGRPGSPASGQIQREQIHDDDRRVKDDTPQRAGIQQLVYTAQHQKFDHRRIEVGIEKRGIDTPARRVFHFQLQETVTEMIDDPEILHDGPDEAEDRNDAASIDEQHEQPLGDHAAIKHVVDQDEQPVPLSATTPSQLS